MNKTGIDTLMDSETIEEYSLRKLQYWLEYEKKTWFLGAVIVWLPYSLILKGLLVLAVIFTPFMLWHLYKAKWYKSIVVFLAVTVLPFISFYFFQIKNPVTNFIFMTTPLLNFYFYTWILSYNIREYLSELQALNKLKDV